jgi:diguanylate cyclase (GGDEF)-like protein
VQGPRWHLRARPSRLFLRAQPPPVWFPGGVSQGQRCHPAGRTRSAKVQPELTSGPIVVARCLVVDTAEGPIAAQTRVLVVDDEEDAFVFARDLLGEVGDHRYTTTWVETVDQAASALEHESYDVVLLDYRLHGEDGLTLLLRLKAQGTNVPVLVVTGHNAIDLDVATVTAGAIDFLTKGELDAVLLDRAIRLARLRHRHEETMLVDLNRRREDALRDALTGLGNRRKFDEDLESALRTVAVGQPLSLLMADADRLKAINDSRGHAAGDAALAGLARALAKSVRPGDLTYRFGGDEFAALLWTADPSTIEARLAGRLSALVRGVGIVTATLAIVAAEPGDSGASLFARADTLMLERKPRARETS